MSNKRVRPTEQSGPAEATRTILISVITGMLVCIVLLMLMSLVMTLQDIPQRAVGPMSTFAITAGALAAGFCCAKIQRRGGLAYGAICGAALCLLVMLVSIAFPGDGFGVLALLKILFMLIGGMLGGVLGVNSRQRRRK